MIKKVFIVISLSMILLSACGAKAPAETPTPTATQAPIIRATETPTATEAPVASEVPAIVPTDTLAPDTPVPTNAPNCTNSASFVTDVTIPDNSNVQVGTIFTKTWRILNNGTCIWGPTYTLTHYTEERLGAPDSVPLSLTLPGQTLDISMDLVVSKGNGIHKGYFVIKNPAGLIMKIGKDSRLWVIVNASGTVANSNATAAPSPTGSGSVAVVNTNPPSSTGSGGATASGPGFATVTCSYTADLSKVTEVIDTINAYRAQNNLPPYSVNTQLTQAAIAHANDMACNQLFFHNGSNGSTPKSRVAASGYVASSVTENVYGSYPPLTGAGAVDWWKNDKTDLNHNKNLLSTKYTEIGVGYSFFNNFGYYVVDFAVP